MQTKEYLNTVNRLNRIIQNKLSDLYQLKELSISVPAVDNKERVQTTLEPDKIGTIVAKIDKMERDIDAKVDELIDAKNAIIAQISDIANERYYNVLFSKYIEGKTLEKIAGEEAYSFRHIKRLHSDALQEFERKFGEKYISLSGIDELIASRR